MTAHIRGIRIENRQPELHARASARLAGDRDVSLMAMKNTLHYAQPDAVAFEYAVGVLVA